MDSLIDLIESKCGILSILSILAEEVFVISVFFIAHVCFSQSESQSILVEFLLLTFRNVPIKDFYISLEISQMIFVKFYIMKRDQF